jgi:hypothetical protein
VARCDTGKNQHELLPPLPGRGFARLPKPDAGDLFFDIEGDPFYELGLEYLFGFSRRRGLVRNALRRSSHGRRSKAVGRRSHARKSGRAGPISTP